MEEKEEKEEEERQRNRGKEDWMMGDGGWKK